MQQGCRDRGVAAGTREQMSLDLKGKMRDHPKEVTSWPNTRETRGGDGWTGGGTGRGSSRGHHGCRKNRHMQGA